MKFTSYCWVVGTTSFRTADFNVQIERQLALLHDFWAIPENQKAKWSTCPSDRRASLQADYYYFMQQNAFVTGDAARPDKDAREKTSGLCDIGLLDSGRRLTSVGKHLLKIANTADFNKDNPLKIANDSLIYLQQLLKTCVNVDGDIVRPLVVALHVILELKYLTNEEFTYLLPLCTNAENTAFIISEIKKIRPPVWRAGPPAGRAGRTDNNQGNVDSIIISRLMQMENYQAALQHFTSAEITENVIMQIGINRKSKTYDKPYYKLYKQLYSVVFAKGDLSNLYEQVKKLSDKPRRFWKNYLFESTAKNSPARQAGGLNLNDTAIIRAKTATEFKTIFFELLHLFKAKATLADYFDLNRRYFKTTDILIFADGKCFLDTLPHCWLHSISRKLLDIAFTAANNLHEHTELDQIADFLRVDEIILRKNLKKLYGISATTETDVNRIITDERYNRFNKLIDERFNVSILLDLFSKFESRQEDDKIRGIVTNNADIPTIFEYILGISWYIISERQGDILEYMNLSLEADLLPRTHASGGNADIEYIYPQSPACLTGRTVYDAHTLLIEATLSEKTNQRRMEMEPISRHLGEYILKTGRSAYAIFVSTTLHRNVISDFRNRRTYEYYSNDFEECVKGLKILLLATAEIKTILESKIKYSQLHEIFENAYISDEPVPTWYNRNIVEKLANLSLHSDSH
ncbi:MAG: AlwI family type II restriction endonuclease [Defluviitaleaceae bacterium]|nr:AlwI family type II restriction endonuclease [Defluviitaleaceae bacterium]